MRFLKTLIAAGAAACAVALATPASADTLQPGNARGKCLETGRYGVVISRCNDSAGQDFRMGRNGRLETDYGCLAEDGEGRQLTSVRCGRGDEQRWDLSDGLLRSRSGLCADVQGGGSQDGTPVQAYRCHGKSNQRWAMGGGGYDDGGRGRGRDDDNYGGVLLSPGNARNKCLDSSDRNGRAMVIHDCHGQDNQRFSFSERGQTEIKVNGDCVTAPRQARKPYYVTSCNGSRDQRFDFKRDGSIVNGFGECVDVLSGGTQNGTLVVPYTCSGTPSQTWTSRRR